MLTLTPAERSWLQAYQIYLKTECPGCVEEISIFGSKVRGDAKADSDLDVYTARDGNRKRPIKAASMSEPARNCIVSCPC